MEASRPARPQAHRTTAGGGENWVRVWGPARAADPESKGLSGQKHSHWALAILLRPEETRGSPRPHREHAASASMNWATLYFHL